MKEIDLNTWSRTNTYKFMGNVDFPFYSLTVPIDVTNVKRVSKEKDLSFYMMMTWLVGKAINSVENFRIRERKGKLYLLDITHPSFTYLKGEKLMIVNSTMHDDMERFCKENKEKAANQKQTVPEGEEPDDLIYISCLPWFDITHLTNERNFDKGDNIPRIAWGKYYEENDRLKLHLSIDVNHIFIDGLHIGKFVEELNRLIEGL